MSSKRNKSGGHNLLRKFESKKGAKQETQEKPDTKQEEHLGATEPKNETSVFSTATESSSITSSKRRRKKKVYAEPSRRSNRVKCAKKQREDEQSKENESVTVSRVTNLSPDVPSLGPLVENKTAPVVCDTQKVGDAVSVVPDALQSMECKQCQQSSIFWVKLEQCGHIFCDTCMYSIPRENITTSGNEFPLKCPYCKMVLLSQNSVLRWRSSTRDWRAVSFLFKNGTRKNKDSIFYSLGYGTDLTLKDKYKSFTWSLYDKNIAHSFCTVGNKCTIKTPAATSGELNVEQVDQSVAHIDQNGRMTVEKKGDTLFRVTDGKRVYEGNLLLVNGIPVTFEL